MLDNIDLVEEYERVEDTEGGVIENARENNVLEVLQPVCVVDLPLYALLLDSYNLFELGFVGEILSVIGLV
jgi:hypothetical protein